MTLISELPHVGRRTTLLLRRAGYLRIEELAKVKLSELRDRLGEAVSNTRDVLSKHGYFGDCYWLRMQRRCESFALWARNLRAAVPIPEACLCPITWDWMSDPVRTEYGNVYDRGALLDYVKLYGTDPLNNMPLSADQVKDDPISAELIAYIRNNFAAMCAGLR